MSKEIVNLESWCQLSMLKEIPKILGILYFFVLQKAVLHMGQVIYFDQKIWSQNVLKDSFIFCCI